MSEQTPAERMQQIEAYVAHLDKRQRRNAVMAADITFLIDRCRKLEKVAEAAKNEGFGCGKPGCFSELCRELVALSHVRVMHIPSGVEIITDFSMEPGEVRFCEIDGTVLGAITNIAREDP